MKPQIYELLRRLGSCVIAWLLAGCLPDGLTSGIGVEKGPDPAVEPPPVEEELPPLETDPAYVPDPSIPELTIDKTAQVAILGYHDFAEKKSSNEMVISTSDFREQMGALHDSGIAVISMDDFLAWRRGEKDIPDPSVLITIDDGWKTTHTLALPVLKEFGFPFTVFLYARYVNGGGRALTTDEINDLIANGASIGSHSWTHPTPGRVRAAAKESPEKYDAFLLRELEESKHFLEDKFGVPVKTFAYPGGIFTDRMIELNAASVGYEALFTCNPARVDWDADLATLNRFIIHSTDDSTFRRATTFPGRAGSALDSNAFATEDGEEAPSIPLTPPNNAVIGERLPLISADLSGVEGIDPASLAMNVSGFGDVTPSFDDASGLVSYTPRQRLRAKDTAVTLSFQRAGQSKPETLIWSFEVDPLAAYTSVVE